MDYLITIHDFKIKCTLSEYGVHFHNDDNFFLMMQHVPRSGVYDLASASRELFRSHYKRSLKISNKSLVAEIWGHYYFERLFIKVKHIFNALKLTRVKRRLKSATAIFDCAEWGYDSNRWLWDILSITVTPISFFIRDKRKNS